MMAKLNRVLTCMALSGALAACGAMKVGLDDQTISTAECLIQNICPDSGSDSTDSGSDSTDSTDTADNGSDNNSDGNNGNSNNGNNGNDNGNNGNGSDGNSASNGGGSTDNGSGDGYSDIPGGTIATMSDGHKGSGRFFMGTFNSASYAGTCPVSGYDFTGYDLPLSVRAYSYGNRIDFENSQGALVWIAQVYPDDTFDFSIQYRNVYGHPGARLDCTCVDTNIYGNTDELSCSCDPSDSPESCTVYYRSI